MATVAATEAEPAPARRRFAPPEIFGLVPEGSVRRRPSDIVQVVVATLALIGAAWVARHPEGFGRWTFEVVTDIPDSVQSAFQFVYVAGTLALVAALVAACLLRRRIRLAVSMLVAAGATWLLGLALSGVVDADSVRDGSSLSALGNPPGFPAIRLATAVSVLFVAAPFLTRPARRLLYTVLIVSAVSAVLAVDGLFTDVLGSFALGWAISSAVHLVIGSPAGTPTSAQVVEALANLGVEVSNLRLVPGPWYWSQYRASLADGSAVEISVIGRDARDARLFGELWRKVWYKNTGAALLWTRRRQVEHWAYLLLGAAHSGARVPDMVVAGVAGRREDAVLVTRPVAGTALDQLAPADVTDAVLDDAWQQLGLLARAQIAKGGVRAAEVTVMADGSVGLDTFSQASYPAPPERTAVDAVDLLVVSARMLGADRAVAAALRERGAEGVTDLLPLLQPAALSAGARHDLGHAKPLIKEVREKAAAATVGEPPKLAEVRRVSLTDLLMVIFTPIGFYLIIGELAGLSDVGNVFKTATWGWVIAAFLIAQTPQFAAAISMVGSVMAPLPFGPVVAVQLSDKFTEIVGGGVADVALTVRFLQVQGQPVAIAVSSGTLNSVAAGVVQVILVPLCFFASGATFDYSGGDGSAVFKFVLLVIIVVGSLTGFVLLIPRLRRRIFDRLKPQWAAARDNVAQVLTHPRKATELFGGKVLGQVLFGMVLYCSVRAYGGDLGLLELIFINCVASIIGGAAPVPGGLGVVEAGLIAGLTAAGLSQDQAIAATFTHRLFTTYLPPITGWFALNWLRRREYI